MRSCLRWVFCINPPLSLRECACAIARAASVARLLAPGLLCSPSDPLTPPLDVSHANPTIALPFVSAALLHGMPPPPPQTLVWPSLESAAALIQIFDHLPPNQIEAAALLLRDAAVVVAAHPRNDATSAVVKNLSSFKSKALTRRRGSPPPSSTGLLI
jgi:hypothetical protein